jgi:hypothetical protein
VPERQPALDLTFPLRQRIARRRFHGQPPFVQLHALTHTDDSDPFLARAGRIEALPVVLDNHRCYAAVFVEAGADHRFTAYEHLSVLVIFERKPAENP